MVSGRSRLSWWRGDGVELGKRSSPSPPSPSHRIPNELSSMRPWRQRVSLPGSALPWVPTFWMLEARTDTHPHLGLEQQNLGYLGFFLPPLLHSPLPWKPFPEVEKIPRPTLQAVLTPAAVLRDVFTPPGSMSCQRKRWVRRGGNLAVLKLLIPFPRNPPRLWKCP